MAKSNISYGQQQVSLHEIYGEVEAKYSIDLDTVNVCEFIVWEWHTIFFRFYRERTHRIKSVGFSIHVNWKIVDYNTFPHANCDYIVILGSGYKQKKKEKKILIDSVINELKKYLPKNPPKDYSCPECLQVVVDKIKYDPFLAMEFLKRILPRQINYIQFYTSPDPILYGENAKNGLVDIRLESKKRD